MNNANICNCNCNEIFSDKISCTCLCNKIDVLNNRINNSDSIIFKKISFESEKMDKLMNDNIDINEKVNRLESVISMLIDCDKQNIKSIEDLKNEFNELKDNIPAMVSNCSTLVTERFFKVLHTKTIKDIESSERLDKMELKIEKIAKERYEKLFVYEIDKLTEIIEKLESKNNIIDNNIHSIINVYDKRFFKLDEMLDDIYNRLDKLESNPSDKKPHKCPVCEGSCYSNLLREDGITRVGACKCCNGKGVIWG